MIDRIPTKVLDNGAIRYGVYGEDGALLRYEYIKPEDEPTQEGTPLNKASLLSDETEMAIWGNTANRTVNKAMHTLETKSWKVGDLRTSLKTDLDDTWVLSNGDVFEEEKYPELTPYTSIVWNAMTWPDVTPAPTSSSTSISYINGYYFVFPSPASNVVYYTTDIACPTWTTLTFDTGYVINCVTYYNGLWVFGGNLLLSAYVLYSDSLNGTWMPYSVKVGSSSSSNNNSFSIISFTEASGYVVGIVYNNYRTYEDSDWYNNYSYSVIVRSSALTPSGTWSFVVSDTSPNSKPPKPVYETSTNTFAVFLWRKMYYSVGDPTKAWSSKTLSDGIVGVCFADFVNGYWVLGLASTSTGHNFYYATTLLGTWTNLNILPTSRYIHSIFWIEGYWLIFDSTGIMYYFKNNINELPGGTGQYKYLKAGVSAAINPKGTLIVGVNNSKLRYATFTLRKLPAISIHDSAYTYIRARRV